MRLMVEMQLQGGRADPYYADYTNPDPAVLIEAMRRRYGTDDLPVLLDRPSLAFTSPAPPPGVAPTPREAVLDRLPSLIAAVRFDNEAKAANFFARVEAKGDRFASDPPITALGAAWNPFADAPPLFHTRPAALALMHAQALEAWDLRGQSVNLVFFDEGISGAALAARFGRLSRGAAPPPLRFEGGWNVAQAIGPQPELEFKQDWDTPEPGFDKRQAGRANPTSHGTMVALNALSLAPAARVFDLPVLPDRIRNVIPFASFAAAALVWARADIAAWMVDAYPGRWVFCHAWGVFDRRLEDPVGGYTTNPKSPLHAAVKEIDLQFQQDQVFAAGNGGQFLPHPYCGPGDIGPGRSILGVNSSPHALTAGAVRADGAWIGYSSQGPGQREFHEAVAVIQGMVEKPDLCAPSHFAEPDDAAFISSGTSAACGMTAGAVAALRSANSPLAALTPADLRAHLRNTAQKPAGEPPGYDIRFGHGILNLEAALQAPP
ncbi:MAG: S8 family serine peptidase [Roseococcus sp.]